MGGQRAADILDGQRAAASGLVVESDPVTCGVDDGADRGGTVEIDNVNDFLQSLGAGKIDRRSLARSIRLADGVRSLRRASKRFEP